MSEEQNPNAEGAENAEGKIWFEYVAAATVKESNADLREVIRIGVRVVADANKLDGGGHRAPGRGALAIISQHLVEISDLIAGLEKLEEDKDLKAGDPS